MLTTSSDHLDTADALRRTARRYATGVTVVAVEHAEGTHGLTANSFVTLSLRPPLIGIAVTAGGRMRRLAETVGSFGVSILQGGQSHHAQHYASRDRSGVPVTFDSVPAAASAKVPIVPDCVAYFACSLYAVHPVGDHDLLVGEVRGCEVLRPDAAPLIFLDGTYGGLA
jgi:flavin reductase (DIM6/NTAB) family NADH-FMN oxidoreductase RutF